MQSNKHFGRHFLSPVSRMHRLIVMKLITVTHYYSLPDTHDIVDIFKVTGSKFKVTGSI